MKKTNFVVVGKCFNPDLKYEPGYEDVDDYTRPITIESIKQVLSEMPLKYESVSQWIERTHMITEKQNLRQFPMTKVIIKMTTENYKTFIKKGYSSDDINRFFPTNYKTEIKEITFWKKENKGGCGEKRKDNDN